MGCSLSLKEAQERLPELIDQIASNRDCPIAVTVDGQEKLLIVDPRHYELMRRLWDNHWEAVRELQERNADADPDEIYRTVTELVEEVRQQRYDARTASSARLD